MEIFKKCRYNIILGACYTIIATVVYTFVANYLFGLTSMSLGLLITLDIVVAIIMLAIGVFCTYLFVKHEYLKEKEKEASVEATL